MTPRDARTWLDALDRVRATSGGRPPGGVWILEPRLAWQRRGALGAARGFLVIALPEAKGANLRGLSGLAVWVLPAHDIESAEWSAEVVPAVAAMEPRALYLHATNWGPGAQAEVVLNRGPWVDSRGPLPPDAPWGTSWDWIDEREFFYDRLIEYCVGEGMEIPAWVQAATARIAKWKQGEGLYGV